MKDCIIHISFAKLYYSCPHCEKEHVDAEDKFLDRLNRSKQGWITVKCDSCLKKIGYTVDMTGQSVGFKLNDKETLTPLPQDRTPHVPSPKRW